MSTQETAPWTTEYHAYHKRGQHPETCFACAKEAVASLRERGERLAVAAEELMRIGNLMRIHPSQPLTEWYDARLETADALRAWREQREPDA